MIKILLAEDDLFLRDIYTEILKDEKYNVTTAENGKEALMKIKTGGWDLVLLDIFMPQMNGIDVLKAIKNNLSQPYTKHMVLMTNTDDPELINEVKESIEGYILKSSVTPDLFVEKVKQILEK